MNECSKCSNIRNTARVGKAQWCIRCYLNEMAQWCGCVSCANAAMRRWEQLRLTGDWIKVGIGSDFV